MADTSPVDGEILRALSAKIETALKQPKLNARERIQLEIHQLTVLYLSDDHPKVAEMWPIYIYGRWAVLVLGGAFLTACATGRIMISFVK